MIRFTFTFLFFLAFIYSVNCQDTFSIVAVDEETGEVGSAGATCLDASDIAGGAKIISRMIPGVGSINTQSFWVPANQINANTKLQEGLLATEIIDWLVANDVDNTPATRQYGVAVLDSEGQATAAGFTGEECFDVKLHKVGTNYSVQGNILLSEDIVNDMEANFLNTEGSLADKLMAALQGANVPGADSRCLAEGVSSQSAFVRVARPDDVEGSYYMDLLVDQTAFGVEPIDSLQKLFDEWSLINNSDDLPSELDVIIFPNPVKDEFKLIYTRYNSKKNTELIIRDPSGKTTQRIKLTDKETNITLKKSMIPSGQYYYTLKEDGTIIRQSSFIVINK